MHADVLADDEFILRALHRIAPLRASMKSGTLSVVIDLSSPAAATSQSGIRKCSDVTDTPTRSRFAGWQ